jgi:hypothetical protein
MFHLTLVAHDNTELAGASVCVMLQSNCKRINNNMHQNAYYKN